MPAQRDLAAEAAAPKYAHCELERRWLVDPRTRPALPDCGGVTIEDRYLAGTRMRLRRMTDRDGRSALKLTEKYEAQDPAARLIVTAYLTESEFAVFGALRANTVRKVRYGVPHGAREWSLDRFEGPLAGLEILEIECDRREELDSLVPPDWAGREITHERQWQGGALAAAQIIPES